MVSAQPVGGQPAHARPEQGRKPFRRADWWSLYAQVLAVNAAILLAWVSVLLWTPVTVSAPITVDQALLIGVMLVVTVAANAVLLRLSFRGLAALVSQMETSDLLRPRERLPQKGGVETRALISRFNEMLDRLEAERLASTRMNLSTLEAERRRISRELHDEIGQRMTGILLQLGRIGHEVPEAAQAQIAGARDEVRAALDGVATLAWQIRPGVLDDFGLLSALRSLTASLADNGRARIDASLPHQLPPLPGETELAIYRIAQESLTNALRHSGATIINVAMRVAPTRVVLQIVDNGLGLPGGGREGAGLRGMRERALLTGGEFSVEGITPQGLRIELTVPTGGLRA